MASSNDFEKKWECYQDVVKTKDFPVKTIFQRRLALDIGYRDQGAIHLI